MKDNVIHSIPQGHDCRTDARCARKGGFSMVELVVALLIFGLLAGGIAASFLQSLALSKAGSSQTNFTGQARIVQQQIMSLIHGSIRVGAATFQGHPAMRMDFDPLHNGSLTHSMIWYQASDQTLRYDPDRFDLYIQGQERVLARNVTPLGQDPIFQVVNNGKSAGTARIRFHLGDSTQDDLSAYSPSGQGYQGVAVRLSVSPRDLHEFRQWNELGDQL